MLRLDQAPLEAVGSVADVVGGGTPPTGVGEYFDGEIPWLTPKDLSGHRGRFVERGSRNLSRAGLERSAATLLPAGAVLISSRAPVGYLAIAGNPLATSQGFRSLVIREGALPAYFYYALRARRGLLLSYASGSTFAELGTRALQEVEVPLAPLRQQRRLAEILDPFDDKETYALSLAAKLLELARALFLRGRKGAVRELPLGELGTLVGGRTPATAEPGFWGGPHSWATPRDLTATGLPFLEATERTLSDAGLRECQGAVAPAGSVLLASRATIGAVTMVAEPVAFNQGCTAYVPREPGLQHYVCHELALRVPYLESLATGTTFLELGKRSLREVPVPLPGEDALADLDRQLALIHRRARSSMLEASRLQALRDGLLQRLFSGG